MTKRKFAAFKLGYTYVIQESSKAELLRSIFDTPLGPRMIFERIKTSDGSYIYRGYNNCFLRVEDAGADPWYVYADQPDASQASHFQEVWFPDDRVGFVYRGLFVSFVGSYDPGYADFMVSSREAGHSQMYFLEVPPPELIPESVASTASPLVKDQPTESRVGLPPLRLPNRPVPAEERIDVVTTEPTLDSDRFRPLER